MDPEITIMHAVEGGVSVSRKNLKVRLSNHYNRKPLPTPYEERVEEVWTEKIVSNPRMWNGTKFRLYSVEQTANTVTFNLGITCYKDFIGTNWSPDAKVFHFMGNENHQNTQVYMSDALGVGAFVETDDNYLILLRRSLHCGEAVGLLDIPGGHPEPQVACLLDKMIK